MSVCLINCLKISIHAPREGGDILTTRHTCPPLISIHAPREGGDGRWNNMDGYKTHFNPRPPRGGRPLMRYAKGSINKFQSTPPARGATRTAAKSRPLLLLFQSTPPARGATPAGSRPPRPWRFQSTPPARGATAAHLQRGPDQGISIHAPREGGDFPAPLHNSHYIHFNPRPPRGGRQQRCTVLPADL